MNGGIIVAAKACGFPAEIWHCCNVVDAKSRGLPAVSWVYSGDRGIIVDAKYRWVSSGDYGIVVDTKGVPAGIATLFLLRQLTRQLARYLRGWVRMSCTAVVV